MDFNKIWYRLLVIGCRWWVEIKAKTWANKAPLKQFTGCNMFMGRISSLIPQLSTSLLVFKLLYMQSTIKHNKTVPVSHRHEHISQCQGLRHSLEPIPFMMKMYCFAPKQVLYGLDNIYGNHTIKNLLTFFHFLKIILVLIISVKITSDLLS